jgi:hypothetical protein
MAVTKRATTRAPRLPIGPRRRAPIEARPERAPVALAPNSPTATRAQASLIDRAVVHLGGEPWRRQQVHSLIAAYAWSLKFEGPCADAAEREAVARDDARFRNCHEQFDKWIRELELLREALESAFAFARSCDVGMPDVDQRPLDQVRTQIAAANTLRAKRGERGPTAILRLRRAPSVEMLMRLRYWPPADAHRVVRTDRLMPATADHPPHLGVTRALDAEMIDALTNAARVLDQDPNVLIAECIALRARGGAIAEHCCEEHTPSTNTRTNINPDFAWWSLEDLADLVIEGWPEHDRLPDRPDLARRLGKLINIERPSRPRIRSSRKSSGIVTTPR